MRLKSFHAPTMAEAMRLVRSTLGDDAIIVASREEEGGVRVTAAIDDTGSAATPIQARPRDGATPLRPPPRSDIDVAEIVAEALRRHRTPHALAERLTDRAANHGGEDPHAALEAALAALFTFEPLSTDGHGGPVMLVGPPGAGKTLTVAKLATRITLKGRRVGVITTDTIRAGGVDQLEAFTRLLKVQLVAAEDAMALADAVTVLGGTDPVLIDSAGRNPFDPADMADLAELIEAARVEPVLVLPGGSDPVEAAEMAEAFRELGARRLVATRLDITRRLGPLLAVAQHARLTFSDASLTARVADGLTALGPAVLAELLLPAAPAAKKTGTLS